MFESFDEHAKRALAFAKYEARRTGSDTVECEHHRAAERNRAGDAIEAVATRTTRFVTMSDLEGQCGAMQGLLDELPVRCALLADRSGSCISSQADLPETLAPWLDGLAYDDRLSEREGSVCLTTETGGLVWFSWITAEMFLLLVPERGTESGRVRAAVARLIAAFAD